MKILAVAGIAGALLCGCGQQGPPAPPVKTATDPAGPERMLGRWTGPEGTYLDLSPDGAGFRVEIADLDGPQIYPGRAAGEHIEFQRKGKTETLRAGNGRDTGMKWLAEKKNCLLTAPGEGWCKD